ncbi:transporter [Saliterribacillus persicus]|uniref:Voltage-gated potassium channel n=1 Tax=Saliterribacillus persicus TaxID=930114 RepID=A0A368XA46_9BACI|nr:transporter [Saliterribacillus persicus]RCW64833.1 voltage-gated potassium channel [Saliterribacillus persicus]
MQQMLKITYDVFMLILVILTVLTLWMENSFNSIIGWIVWFIFFVDFVVRFFKEKKKWVFIKKNPFLVIAIVPFDQFFQVARIVRLIYLFRIKTITKYYINPYLNRMSKFKKTLISPVLLVLLLVLSLSVFLIENKFDNLYESVYIILQHLFLFASSFQDVDHFTTIILLTFTSMIGVIIQGLALQWLFVRIEKIWNKVTSTKMKLDNK